MWVSRLGAAGPFGAAIEVHVVLAFDRVECQSAAQCMHRLEAGQAEGEKKAFRACADRTLRRQTFVVVADFLQPNCRLIPK